MCSTVLAKWQEPGVSDRSSDLAVLGAARRRAGGGNGALVLIAGEAGVGKSRFLQEFSEGGVSGRSVIVTGSCSRHLARPYGPFIDALREIAKGAVLDSAPAITETLKTIAARRTAILLVENVQYADVASLKLLSHLSSVVGRVPLLVIATYRPEEIQLENPAFAYLASLHRAGDKAAFEFRHILTQEVLYGVWLDAEVQPLHARDHASARRSAGARGRT